MKTPVVKRAYKHQFKETARQDPYRSRCKPQGTPRCPICRSVSFRGRWVSVAQTKILHHSILTTGELKCPACKQLEEHFALGVVELRGTNWKENKEIVMNTIRRTEEIARIRNDQERILWVKEMVNFAKVYVSLPELARRIGRELEKSFQGNAEYEHSTEEPYIRVRWLSDLPHMKHRPGSTHVALPLKGKSKAFRTRSRRF